MPMIERTRYGTCVTDVGIGCQQSLFRAADVGMLRLQVRRQAGRQFCYDVLLGQRLTAQLFCPSAFYLASVAERVIDTYLGSLCYLAFQHLQKT